MRKLVLFALVPALLYPFLLLLLSFEHIQRHAIYMASINWPLFARYDQSEYYGFEAGTWSKFLLPTPDGAQIGVTYMKTTVPSASERRAICRSFVSSDFHQPLPCLLLSSIFPWQCWTPSHVQKTKVCQTTTRFGLRSCW